MTSTTTLSARPTTTTTRHGAVTAVVCTALAAVVAAMASLNVALPGIGSAMHASQTRLEWVIDAYSLVFAALLLPAGAIGDRYGRRRALVAGLLIFGTGSAVAMTAGSITELIALRAMLGLGAALVMPATLSTITGTFPKAQRIKAVSIWAGVAGGSAVLGLLASGVLLEFWDWRSVFGLNVALAVIAIAGTLCFVPESADENAPRIDVVGALLAVAGLVALVYSVIEAPTVGWLSVSTLAGIGIGIVVLAGFVVFELHHPTPMLDPRIFGHRRLSAGSLTIFVQFFAFFGFIFLVLQYLQLVRGDSAIVSALSMLPMAATMMPASRLAPGLVSRFGSRSVCVSGLVLIAGALTVLAQLETNSSYWLLAAGLVALGAGMGLSMTPATSAITETLPAAQQGVGSAMNDLSRELGGAIGIAVIGSILTATYRNNLPLPAVPAAVAGKARESLGVAAHLGPDVRESARIAFTAGVHSGLLFAAAAVVCAALAVAVLLPRRVVHGEDAATSTADGATASANRVRISA